MSFGYRTPESLLPRSDSKNPATTCKGLTSSGRPCRRALAAGVINRDSDGVLAVLDEGSAAAFFCWQHKDQAEILVSQIQNRSKILHLKQKSSIDTLLERFGVLDMDEDGTKEATTAYKPQKKQGRSSQYRTKKGDTLPEQWRSMEGPLMSVPEEIVQAHDNVRTPVRKHPSRPGPPSRNASRFGRSNVRASWSCCIQADDDDDHRLPAPRRHDRHEYKHRRSENYTRPFTSTHQHHDSPASTPIKRKPLNTLEMQQKSLLPTLNAQDIQTDSIHSTPTRPILQHYSSTSSPPNPTTASFLSLIPPHLSPSTTSALLAELSKPISQADEEGYIYIFWLTPESEMSKPDDETASSLLDSEESLLLPASNPSRQQGRMTQSQQTTNSLTAQALRRYASIRHTPQESKKILLKIGRAANVHRRLSQWTRQCGQNITLIRYYPYESQSRHVTATSMQGYSQRMVPHVHRVERLIHLELTDKRVTDKDTCQACGKIHKEWFEVDATRQGVRDVDEVVRRWVEWAEGLDRARYY